MPTPTVDWTATQIDVPKVEGLRERKKRLMRQRLTDTATMLFMERGFDAFRVSEVAAACGVSDKTVYNYFPTKESLILDRLTTSVASFRNALNEPNASPVDAALRVLDAELDAHTSWLLSADDPAEAAAAFQRFRALVDETPSLRDYENAICDRMVDIAAASIADRAGLPVDDPEPVVAASALVGLWRIQARAMRRYVDGARPPGIADRAIRADVARAARLINSGLQSLPAVGSSGRSQGRTAPKG